MSEFEVPEPILNSPFDAPSEHWFIHEGQAPERRPGRRPSIAYPPRDKRKTKSVPWSLDDGTLRASREYAPGFELAMVNLIRERVAAWREAGYPGVTRTTLELLNWWQRDGRDQRLFFAQREAAETIIFMTEARADFRQGINIPRDEPSDDRKEEGYSGFLRYACKMATGSGKTTVMAMLAAWSILNKVNDRSDGRFSDIILVICPNVTIRGRLRELEVEGGEASIYRTRDLIPPDTKWLSRLGQGRVLIRNWHVLAPQGTQTGGESAKVVKAGREVRTMELIHISDKTTTARGKRYLTQEDFDRQVAAGMLTVMEEERDRQGVLKKARVESFRYVESDTALVNRVLGREVGGKQNILVLNDEAHHAYRIGTQVDDEDQGELFDNDDEEDLEFDEQEATVWIEGLDRIQKLRGINFCVDLSATPYFLGRVGRETNRPFPWIVSDFALTDAIESGLTKIPQLAVRDTTGAEIAGYFNVWDFILPKLTAAERGGRKGDPKPEAILKYAHTPIGMLAALWREETLAWQERGETRLPVFILVCKTTKLAKVVYEWLAEDKCPSGIPPLKVDGFRNAPGEINTIRVDTKVVHETDTAAAKEDEKRWMRFTLDTVGKAEWPTDRQGRAVYPEGYEELAKKLDRPLHPPGRDVRCIVSVGMLTEGWDCNTVTHIVGLRPFLSQLLCEQVVGRGLRRAGYEPCDDGKFPEEVAKVFGVPFDIVPFKASTKNTPTPPPKKRVFAQPGKAQFEITFPRVEGYTQAIRNRVAVDFSSIARLVIDPMRIPPEVDMKASIPSNLGRPSLTGPGTLENVTLNPYRQGRRLQELAFDMAAALTKQYVSQPTCEAPPQVLFPQLAAIVTRYLSEKVDAVPPAQSVDAFLSPYYGWIIERLAEAIHPDISQGEAPEVPRYEQSRGPGSTADVDFSTSRDVREAVRCHLNYVVCDTVKWEQSAAYRIDRHKIVAAFVKNAGLGFAIPYLHNGRPHDYVPDFIIRLLDAKNTTLILETKGYDVLAEVKEQAANRWVAAVNADGSFGQWAYRMARGTGKVDEILDEYAREAVLL